MSKPAIEKGFNFILQRFLKMDRGTPEQILSCILNQCIRNDQTKLVEVVSVAKLLKIEIDLKPHLMKLTLKDMQEVLAIIKDKDLARDMTKFV